MTMALAFLAAMPPSNNNPTCRAPDSESCTTWSSDPGSKDTGPGDFEVSHCIGRGSYASVYLARHLDTHELCALKAVKKRAVARDATGLRHLRSEKKVLELMDSPFVVAMRGTFQDGHYVYFALEHCAGGDLYRRLRKAAGSLPLDHVQFYVAGVILAVQHVHGSACVHRDIKPENILLDAGGYPKLIDFGFARRLARGEQLLSLFGTPEYAAPEVLLGRGHAQAADLWSLGVLTYELLVGATPWCATGRGTNATPPSTEDIFERITSGYVPFPPDMDRPARDLITRLLQQDPKERLGMAGWGLAELWGHPFFRRIDWAALKARQFPAPCVPSGPRRGPEYAAVPAVFSPLVCSGGVWVDDFDGVFDGF